MFSSFIYIDNKSYKLINNSFLKIYLFLNWSATYETATRDIRYHQ